MRMRKGYRNAMGPICFRIPGWDCVEPMVLTVRFRKRSRVSRSVGVYSQAFNPPGSPTVLAQPSIFCNSFRRVSFKTERVVWLWERNGAGFRDIIDVLKTNASDDLWLGSGCGGCALLLLKSNSTRNAPSAFRSKPACFSS
jgi:hypothetical protein